MIESPLLDQLRVEFGAEAMAKGLADGLAVGRAQGRADTIVRLLEKRFGTIGSETE